MHALFAHVQLLNVLGYEKNNKILKGVNSIGGHFMMLPRFASTIPDLIPATVYLHIEC